MQEKIKSCPNKGYWYWGMVGEVISITGEKVVDDGLHEKPFVLGKDNNVSLKQISYLTPFGKCLCECKICQMQNRLIVRFRI